VLDLAVFRTIFPKVSDLRPRRSARAHKGFARNKHIASGAFDLSPGSSYGISGSVQVVALSATPNADLKPEAALHFALNPSPTHRISQQYDTTRISPFSTPSNTESGSVMQLSLLKQPEDKIEGHSVETLV
jgi:hypothetical protein